MNQTILLSKEIFTIVSTTGIYIEDIWIQNYVPALTFVNTFNITN